MKRLFFTAILSFALFSVNAFAQNSKTFFQAVEGKWQGTLEYQDYTSNKRVTMNILITFKPSADGNSAEVFTVYDDFGKIYKSNSKESIDPAAKKFFDDETEFRVESIEPGKLVISGKTEDGNSIEPTRKTITFTNDTLTILKETRTPWMFRHVYTLKRVVENRESEKVLSAAELQEDFAVFKKILVAIHPGIYRYNSPESLEKDFAEFESKLKNPLREGEFFILIAQFTKKLKCGHTFTNPYNQDKDLRERLFNRRNYLPFYFRIVDGKMIITANASSKNISAGSEITRINGFAVKEIVEKLLTVTKGDGNATLEHRLNSIELARSEAETYALFDWFFPLFFPLTDEIYSIEAVDFAGKKETKFEILAMTKSERTLEMAKRYGATPTYDDGWKFEIQDNSTAYLKIDNSITWRLKTIKFKEFLANAFAELRAKNIKNLIIDLRGNGGGSMDIGFELARYLAREKLAPYAESRRLVRNIAPQPELLKNLDTYSDELKENLKSGVPIQRFRKSGANYFEITGKENYPAIEPYENNFRGQAFIISDASNASATFQFLDYVKTNRLARIVGQTTGGNRQGINGGNYFFLYLPNSRIEIDIPVYFQAPKTLNKDEGVIPDILVKRRPEDIGNNFDRELSVIKDLIRK
ncbi:MAG TPA: S41 family peptidase [Pyrinomonadaceae bacterium]|nr:S41 family peptidase [Pyrinomonadaceae bacterium]